MAWCLPGRPAMPVLDNGGEGEIYAPISAVLVYSTAYGGTIDNSGLICSDTYGVHIVGAPGIETVINNADGATINGGVGAIRNEADGRITLTNRGTIDGSINCNLPAHANDWIANRGRITGDVSTGTGRRSLRGQGRQVGRGLRRGRQGRADGAARATP